MPPAGTSWRFSREKFDELVSDNRIYFGEDGSNVPRYKRFLTEVQQGLVPLTIWPHSEVGHNQDAKSEITKLGLLGRFDTPKPLRLLLQILKIATDKEALIIDSFSGSGTTAHAVLAANKLDGGARRFIMIEMEKKIAKTVTAKRISKVIEGYEFEGEQKTTIHSLSLNWKTLKDESFWPSDIISNAINKYDDQFEKITGEVRENTLNIIGINNYSDWAKGLGGGFRYCTLGTPLFNEYGDINQEVTFPDLAAHIFFSETGLPLPKKVDGTTSLIGQHKDKIVYLLFSQADQGFPREAVGNVLTPDMLATLPAPPDDFEGSRVVYAEGCTVSEDRLRAANVVFKHIPYHIEGA